MLQAAFLIASVALLGALMGSFASVLVTRYKTPYAFIFTKGRAARSACPQCKTPLRALDLVPVFSWLLLGGKCRHCQAPIPRFYLYLEVFSAAVALFLAQVLGLGWGFVLCLLAQPFAVASVYLFLRRQRPPFIYIALALTCLLIGLLLQYANQQSVQYFAL